MANPPDDARLKRPSASICLIAQCLLSAALVESSIVVPLSDAAAAMRLVAERCHVIMEGAAGCAVAAALSGRVRGTVVAIVSGGNIDLDTFSRLVGSVDESRT